MQSQRTASVTASQTAVTTAWLAGDDFRVGCARLRLTRVECSTGSVTHLRAGFRLKDADGTVVYENTMDVVKWIEHPNDIIEVGVEAGSGTGVRPHRMLTPEFMADAAGRTVTAVIHFEPIGAKN